MRCAPSALKSSGTLTRPPAPRRRPLTANCSLLTAHCFSPAAVLAVVLGFFRPSFADFSFGFQRYQLAGVLLHFEAIGAVIAATVTSARRHRRSRNPQSGTKHEQSSDARNNSCLHTR